jgi:uncharacterized protein (DUF608 family)
MTDGPSAVSLLALILLYCSAVLVPHPIPARAHNARVNAAAERSDWIDVSHSLGFPLGGLGTGYSAFGQFGFVKVNFEGRPTDKLGRGLWEYTAEPAVRSSFGFVVTDVDQPYVLQTTPASWSPDARPFPVVTAATLLPRARATFSGADVPIAVTVNCFTPLIPHDLDSATTPVRVFDVTIGSRVR